MCRRLLVALVVPGQRPSGCWGLPPAPHVHSRPQLVCRDIRELEVGRGGSTDTIKTVNLTSQVFCLFACFQLQELVHQRSSVETTPSQTLGWLLPFPGDKALCVGTERQQNMSLRFLNQSDLNSQLTQELLSNANRGLSIGRTVAGASLLWVPTEAPRRPPLTVLCSSHP